MAIQIQGGNPIGGEVSIQGAKNAVLPMIAAAVLCEEKVVIDNCPDISDVTDMRHVFELIGGTTELKGHTLELNGKEIAQVAIECEAASRIRASFLFMGSLLSRFHQAKICYPGGCSIGSRPIDLHIYGFQKMGVEIEYGDDGIFCYAPNGIRGAKIEFVYPSVGATENVVLLAACAEGETTIVNAAREPEVVALCQMLQQMGARIEGIGTKNIHIIGVPGLHGVTYRTCSDRIVAMTYAMFVAGCGGELIMKTEPVFSEKENRVMEKLGCELTCRENEIVVRHHEKKRDLAYVKTGPYPQFPTDGQSLLMAVLCKGTGHCIIEENVFENRFRMVTQLKKMGADIDTVSNRARINSVTRLHGAVVDACDLRSGAGLLIAASMAEGVSEIYNEHYIMRGYDNLICSLNQIGVKAGKDEGNGRTKTE